MSVIEADRTAERATRRGDPPRGLLMRLFAPIDIAPLVYFRVLFGAIMLWEVGRYFSKGWIYRKYILPEFHFTYYGFEWLRPWPGEWMYAHFTMLGLLAVAVMLGLCYRAAAVLFFVGFAYVFLLDQAAYLNHFYLVSLISFLMIFVPAHRALSIDAWLEPKIRARTAPAWALFLIRAQLGIVYFYGGLAKLNGDWLRGEPMRIWLASRTHYPVLGRYFAEEWAVAFFGYGGLLLDLLIVPLLLWRRTRLLALGGAIAFHLLNNWLFRIGIFPWLALAATLLFFPVASWSRVFQRLRMPGWNSGTDAQRRRDEPVQGHPQFLSSSVRHAPLTSHQWVTLVLLGGYLLMQLLVPFRHWLYPGNVSWTEEGHRFSWHMKLRTKRASARFFVTDPATGQVLEAAPSDYLPRWQMAEMSTRPDMILQFAHMLVEDFRQQGVGPVEVRAEILASLNGRRPQLLINPNVDLAKVRRSLRPAKWILPLTEPLRPQSEAGAQPEEDD